MVVPGRSQETLAPKRCYVVLNDGRRKLLRFHDGEPGVLEVYTTSCSGCFEFGDYGGLAHHYGYSERHNCHVGCGCEECGYHGVRQWEEFVPLKHCLDNWQLVADSLGDEGSS